MGKTLLLLLFFKRQSSKNHTKKAAHTLAVVRIELHVRGLASQIKFGRNCRNNTAAGNDGRAFSLCEYGTIKTILFGIRGLLNDKSTHVWCNFSRGLARRGGSRSFFIKVLTIRSTDCLLMGLLNIGADYESS